MLRTPPSLRSGSTPKNIHRIFFSAQGDTKIVNHAQTRRGDHRSSACKKSDFHKRAIHESPLRSRIDVTVNFVATLFRPITLKPCRDRRPRRSGRQHILLFIWLQIIAGCKFKFFSFLDRRKAIAADPYRRLRTFRLCVILSGENRKAVGGVEVL